MERYKKKPVIVEAVQFNGLNPTEIKDFVGENCKVEIYDNGITPPIAHIVIHTLEGDMEVSNGDYIIKGVKGEFYPCKPDIFEQTYESAETQKELEEVDLEKFTEKMNDWKARYNHPDNIPIKATMAFTARMFYMYPKAAREWYESLPKVTQD